MLAKSGKLKGKFGAIYIIPDSLHLFPFDKSNEVSIQTLKDTTVTLTFYTDRGLVDHYSGFIYTNEPEDMKSFDEKVKKGGNNSSKEANWYYISE